MRWVSRAFQRRRSRVQPSGLPPGLYFIAVIMGVVTGCFGGIIRDIIGNKVPTVFKKTQLYATCSLTGCVMYLLLSWAGLPAGVSIPLGTAVTFLVRMLAVAQMSRFPSRQGRVAPESKECLPGRRASA